MANGRTSLGIRKVRVDRCGEVQVAMVVIKFLEI